MSKPRSSTTVARPRPYAYAPRDTQRARRKSPTRPGRTLFTATPATTISTKRALREPRVRDPAPARRLEPVHDSHARNRPEERRDLDALEGPPDAAEVRSSDREDEEDDRDRDPDRGRDHDRPAPPGPGHLPGEGSRTRARDGRVGDDGHARSIVRGHGTGHTRGSRPTLAHGPDRRSDAKAKIVR